MSDPQPNRNSSWKRQLRAMGAELAHMITLRQRLATLELNHDRKLLRRAAIIGGIGIAMILISLPLLLVAAADQLARHSSLAFWAWACLLGLVLFIPGVLLSIATYRSARSDLCGLRGTLAELNEDLVWLREWVERDASAASDGQSEDS